VKGIDVGRQSGIESNLLARVFIALAMWPSKNFNAPACLCCAVFIAFATGAAQERIDASASRPISSQAVTQPRCRINGTSDITIHCDYTRMPLRSAQSSGEPQIALNRAMLSFTTEDSNWMRLELRFTRTDRGPISVPRPVYIAFDDDAGHNFIRRPLPNVNLAGLVPGRSADFHERLLVPALQPGHYQISLWIPSDDPEFKFNAAHNLILSSYGVGDDESGLNRIAEFSVKR
jgi:hypothetical protein